MLHDFSQKWFFNKFPRVLRYGFLSGLTTSLVSTLVISLLTITIAKIETGASVFEYSFQESFFSMYIFIHILSFIIWIAIALSITSFLIPEEEKRLKQSYLFLTNSISAIVSYTVLNFFFLIVLFAILVSTSMLFRV